MIRTRYNHWTCSKFADYIRGEKKPFALEWGKWEQWDEEQKKKRPIRFWLSDTGLKYVQDIVYFPYDLYRTVKFYIRNRYIDKTHYLKTGLKPGTYYELDYRILYALFNELVDFVEIELAGSMMWDTKKQYKIKNGRCLEAAYDYFKWASKLKDTYPDGRRVVSEQAKDSRTIKKLYEWWKHKRPNRISPGQATDWNKYLDEENSREKNKAFKKYITLEEKYDNEDTKMLIELIKIRHRLWT